MIPKIPVHWIWSKGIAALCDHRFPEDFPDGIYDYHGYSDFRSDDKSYHSLSSGISEGDLVWVRTNKVRYFVQHILPQIKAKFVLVTGDNDLSMPSSFSEEASILLKSPQVIHWYIQNFDATIKHEKISLLPIGMDFHSVQQQSFWGMPKMSIKDQHEALGKVRKSLSPTSERIPKIYIDSQFRFRQDHYRVGAINNFSRKIIWGKLASNPLVFEQTQFLPQHEMWRERGKYLFVLSHHGNGLDCHRTWEALVLGHIVIMQHSSLDPLFEDLPVILISDWSAINQTNLDKWQENFKTKNFNTDKLTNQYWIDQMRNKII